MASDISIRKAKELWETWDIRILILISLLIQVLLTFLAPLRKRKASGPLKLVLWLLYLAATTIGLYVISHISSSRDKSDEMIDLLAFWAPFLLLHLGGPDTITALALEDNELWHRHALELVTQVSVTIYVFAYCVVRGQSRLWFPSMLIFVDGCIKYFERTQSLYYASIDSFRDSLVTDPEPGPNYVRLMEVYLSLRTADIPSEIQGRDDPSPEDGVRRAHNDSTTNEEDSSVPQNNDSLREDTDEIVLKANSTEDGARPAHIYSKTNEESSSVPQNNDFLREDTDDIVRTAYDFYKKFKGLLADNFLSLKDRRESRDAFLKKKGPEAFRIIEIELNLIYDIFYTKAFLLHSGQAFLRVICFLSVVTSLVWFSLLDKSTFHYIDVGVTYVLLVGAIGLDMSSCTMLVLSDWYIIMDLDHKPYTAWVRYTYAMVLKLSKYCKRRRDCDRWSRSISEFNLLKRYFRDLPQFIKYVPLKRLRDILIGSLYVKSDTNDEELIVKFIVAQLQMKADLIVNDDNLEIIKQVCSSRGNLVLEEDYFLISDYLKPWTTDVDYDESLLTWHLATDICYYTRSSTDEGDPIKISKKLSDYMTYLLLCQQTLLSTVVGMSDKRFADTCAEAQEFEMKRLKSWYSILGMKIREFVSNATWKDSSKYNNKARRKEEAKFKRDFCKRLLLVNVDVRPIVAKGDKSKSVLFEACRLAMQLKLLGEDKQWDIISKVWVELLCYAAVRCSPRAHVAQLSKGGELITLVWLLMAHLGFGDRFLQNQGFGWTKLIIQK